jgi:hypothetical protein
MLRCTIKPATTGPPAILYSGDSGMAGLFHCKHLHIDKETTLPETLTGADPLT